MIALRDGRKVRLEEYGDPAGAPALWFHGAGSSRLEAGVLDAPARDLGLRVISLDRPGAGGSDPHPGRTVTGYAADIVEVLDAFDIGQAAVGGLSAGGMFAMAAGATIPDRVLRVVPVNSTTPVADRKARIALSPSARMAYAFMKRRPQLAAGQALKATSRARLTSTLTRRSNPDAGLFEDPATAAAWATNLAESQRQPDSGYLLEELTLATAPWGFDHRAVQLPVFMVSGEKDPGLGYAKVWADELPQGQLVVVPGGHSGMLAPAVARRVAELLAGRP